MVQESDADFNSSLLSNLTLSYTTCLLPLLPLRRRRPEASVVLPHHPQQLYPVDQERVKSKIG